jgi:DHA2 family multidrug resistance protein
MNAVDRLQAGAASALLSVAQRVGGSFGIAFLATMLQRRTVVHLERLSDRLTVMGGMGTDAVNQLKYAALSIGYGGTDALNAAYGTVMTFVSKSAQTRAFGDVFVMAAFLTFLGFPAAVFLSRRIPRREALMSKESPSPPPNKKLD